MNRLLRLGACLSLITALLVAAVLAAPSHGVAQDGATDGSLQSIAHGAVALPAGPLAWRVITDQAGDRDSETPSEQALGFTLATDGTLLVETPATGAQDLLLPGSAAFVADGTVETRSGIDGPTAYDRIALVPADQASDAGSGELLLAGEGFAVPTGNRALDLSRAVLAPGQTVTSPALDSQTPSLVFVTDGSVDVTFGGGDMITLVADSAAVLDGELTIASTDGGTLVVGTISAEVPVLETTTTSPTATATPGVAATPTASAAGTPVAGGESGDGIDENGANGGEDSAGGDATGSGTLAVGVLDCSAGTLLDTTTCAPLAGVNVSVVVAGAETSGVTDASGQFAPVQVAVGAPVSVNSVTGGPEGLDLLNVPFAIPAFEGDTIIPIVFDAPAEEPVIKPPATEEPVTDGTGGTPVAGGEPTTGDTTGVPGVLTIQALDCRAGDLVTLEGCVAMPNATFSVTRGTETASTETGFTTDANGFVTFSAEPGSSVTATYAFGAPTGVAPNNDGQVLEPVDGDSTLTFIFVDVNESNG